MLIAGFFTSNHMATLGKLPQRLAPPGQRIATMQAGSWRTDKQSSSARGYGYRWQQARAAYLADNPLCVYCQREGRVTAADVVNHKVPHRGDQVLFWDKENWESLCKRHHDSDAQRAEKSGKVTAKFGADGRVIW